MSKLAQFMDSKMIQQETGLPRSSVDRIMRRCTLVTFDGVRKTYVRRRDIEALIREEPALTRPRGNPLERQAS